MVLFKDVKKPIIKSANAGAEVSSLRPRYVQKTPPCVAHCPNGANVREWLVAIAQHDAYGRTAEQAFEAAWRTITEVNPFPAICGRVCQHPCEHSCNRSAKEGPVAINLLERFVGDYGVEHGLKAARAAMASGVRIAVVGAGPAGLSAAYHLAKSGHAVTLFDAAPLPGGMMRYRIPRQVLPADVLDAEIGNVLQLGIEYRPSAVVGQDVSVSELRRDYQAVFFAIGLQKAAQLALRADGGVAVVGELPADLPQVGDEPAETDRKAVNSVSPAIAQGRAVAEQIAAFLAKRGVTPAPSAPVIKKESLKLDYYKTSPRHEVADGFTAEQAIEEAKRCMSCGMCMDCETCWMYCTNSCFVKLPKGEHYKIKVEVCNGCKKCADACPCGYIEMN